VEAYVVGVGLARRWGWDLLVGLGGHLGLDLPAPMMMRSSSDMMIGG
jgi:hypothetical protein